MEVSGEEKEEFFKEEQNLLNRFKENITQTLSFERISEEYKLLGSKYDALLRQTLKLMKIGDSNQRRLIKTQNELQDANNQLELTYKNLKSLSELGQTLTSSLDTKEIILTINEHIQKIMESDIITIGMYEEAKEIIKYKFLVKNHKYTPSMASEQLLPSTFSGQCISEKKEIIVQDLEEEYPEQIENSKILWDEILKSQVYLPLQVENRLIGIFSVQSYNKNAYNTNQLSILRTMASYVAIAIDNADAYKELSKKNKQLSEQMERIKTLNEQIEEEMKKSEKLLLNILPHSIAERLKKGENIISDYFPEASVLFADIAGFTKMSSKMSSQEKLVDILNEIFTNFDRVANKYGLEKIKTIGDCYMMAGGIPVPNEDHLLNITEASLEMIHTFQVIQDELNIDIALRIGINAGPIVAGVIGKNKFVYDLWGDTVNIASRMESNGMVGRVNCSEYVYEKLNDRYHFEPRGELEVKGKGPMKMYFLKGSKT
jgi:class 3 adenylate cyclase/putative methionine-R-sulfoxide reductase with GAF domain